MNRLVAAAVVLGLAAVAAPAGAHPAPFSYIDVRVEPGALDVSVVAHVFDVGHDLKIDDFEQLLDPSFAEPRAAAIAGLLGAALPDRRRRPGARLRAAPRRRDRRRAAVAQDALHVPARSRARACWPFTR